MYTGPVRRDTRSTVLAPLAAIAVVDALVLPRLRRRVTSGAFDELAHLATGSIVLAALPRASGRLARGVLIGSVLLDADHVPEAFGLDWLRMSGTRPVTHSVLGLVALSAGLASLRPRGQGREVARGARIGIAAHLARDLATGRSAVVLLWPLSRRPFTIRYRTYAGALVATAAFAAAGERRRTGTAERRAGARLSDTSDF